LDPTIQNFIDQIPRFRGKEIAVRALPRGLTNRNYRITCGEDHYVLRIPGANTALLGIDRNVEYACSQAAFAAGIGPEVVAFFPYEGVMLTRFVTGKVQSAKSVQQPDVLRRVVASVRRYHEGPSGMETFSPFETVRQYYAEAKKRSVTFPTQMPEALERFEQIRTELGTASNSCSCHNDLLPANFIDQGNSILILDWEYAGVGDPFFDLGNLAANSRLLPEGEKSLLRFYFGKVRIDDQRRLRLMRMASDMREAMWGFLQMGISRLNVDYKAYTSRYFKRFFAASTASGRFRRMR